jgi:alpha-L-fucosidase
MSIENYHPAWTALYGPAQPEDVSPFDELLQDWPLRTCELVDSYHSQLVWFDWWIEQPAFEPYLRAFAACYYQRAAAWGQGVALNIRSQASCPPQLPCPHRSPGHGAWPRLYICCLLTRK